MKITKSIEQPIEVIEEFADNLGYQSVIHNPGYFPAVGDTPAVGTPTLPNPETKLEFVSRKFDENATAFFGQFAEREARRASESTIAATVDATKAAIAATITTVIE